MYEDFMVREGMEWNEIDHARSESEQNAPSVVENEMTRLENFWRIFCRLLNWPPTKIAIVKTRFMSLRVRALKVLVGRQKSARNKLFMSDISHHLRSALESSSFIRTFLYSFVGLEHLPFFAGGQKVEPQLADERFLSHTHTRIAITLRN